MGRPRAGHGSTEIQVRSGKTIRLIADSFGRWITTGEAKTWKRCTRCRIPTDVCMFGSGLCITCYFYKSGLPVTEFWRMHDEGYPLAPYNIGKAMQRNGANLGRLEDAANWRKTLREMFPPPLEAPAGADATPKPS